MPKTLPHTGRIMIIVWKWNNMLLNERKEESAWEIEGCPNDKLYCISDKFNPAFVYGRVRALVDQYISTSRLFIFLHRSGRFTQETVQDILDTIKEDHEELFPNCKCFLFGDNRDYIYLSTKESGLLGTDGHFHIYENQEKTDVRRFPDDPTKRVIKAHYYNQVWKYYEHEFKSKLFNLYEEFMIRMYRWYNETNEEDSSKMYNQLTKTKFRNIGYLSTEDDALVDEQLDPLFLLYLRIKSLQNTITKADLQLLILAEKQDAQSYVFDDVFENLRTIYDEEKVAKNYSELVQALDQHLMEPNEQFLIPQKSIRSIRNKFQNLLLVMPEATFY